MPGGKASERFQNVPQRRTSQPSLVMMCGRSRRSCLNLGWHEVFLFALCSNFRAMRAAAQKQLCKARHEDRHIFVFCNRQLELHTRKIWWEQTLRSALCWKDPRLIVSRERTWATWYSCQVVQLARALAQNMRVPNGTQSGRKEAGLQCQGDEREYPVSGSECYHPDSNTTLLILSLHHLYIHHHSVYQNSCPQADL